MLLKTVAMLVIGFMFSLNTDGWAQAYKHCRGPLVCDHNAFHVKVSVVMNRVSPIDKLVTNWFVSLLMIAFFIEMLPFCGLSIGCSQYYLLVEQNSEININVRLSLQLQWTCVYPLAFIF